MTFTVEARLADRNLDVTLSVAPGETVAILGPNGAGKSTTLDIIAGLLRPDSGSARLGGTRLFDVGPGSTDLWMPPHRRGVALLSQEPLLFPHLSVLDNVAFAPRSAGQRPGTARAAAHSWLVAVDAHGLESRRPAQLSGGQAQRVAIARALAAEPKLLVLDEPLASLDVAGAPSVRQTLRSVLADRSAIIVTHEMLDALSLADRIVVMNDGGVVESGRTREVLEHPRHPFTAELAGLNLILGISTRDGIRATSGLTLVSTAGVVGQGVQAAAAFRPTAVTVHTQRPPSASNVIRVLVNALEPRSSLVRVRANGVFADLTPGEAADLDLWPGQEAFFAIDSSDIAVYPLKYSAVPPTRKTP